MGATATPVYEAPSTPGELVFELTITGPGGPLTSTTKVTILDSAPAPIANAGADQKDVKQGTTVTLDGRGSEHATKYSWKQVTGTPVQLNAANTATPTFTFPKQPGSLIFELTATGAGRTSVDTVEIFPAPDTCYFCRISQ